MKRLIQWSIDNHWIVIAMSVLLAAAGFWVARDMPVDVFPDLTAPTVTILTEGRGMAPEEMESLVTFPIEAAINGASGVRRVRSATALGIAVVWVEFDWGTDIFGARQIVAEKLALVGGTLPPQVDRPVLAPISSIMGEILFFAISSDTDDPLALRTVADTVVRRRLLAIAGVSQVTPLGGAERQFQVIAHPDQLRANSVSVTELLDAVRGASQNTSAGIFTEGPQEYVLQAVGRVRIARGDRRKPGRAARLAVGAHSRRGRRARGRRAEARRRIAERQAGGHRRRAEAAGRQHHRADQAARPRARHAPEGAAARDDHRPEDLPAVRLHRGGRRQRRSRRCATAACSSSSIVLFFLANVRAATITLTAMPLSLAAAVLVLRAFGATINTMTLGGMAIAIGALVDDAIIDVENVVRRLRENNAKPPEEQRPAAEVVRDATLEIRTSIVFATIIIVMVFLPIFGLSGVEGRLLAPLAVAYIVSLIASLAVAVVVTPALC